MSHYSCHGNVAFPPRWGEPIIKVIIFDVLVASISSLSCLHEYCDVLLASSERETNIPNGTPAQMPSNSLCDGGLLRHTEDLCHSRSSGGFRVFCGGGGQAQAEIRGVPALVGTWGRREFELRLCENPIYGLIGDL